MVLFSLPAARFFFHHVKSGLPSPPYFFEEDAFGPLDKRLVEGLAFSLYGVPSDQGTLT